MDFKRLLEVRKHIFLYSFGLFISISFVYFSIAIVLDVNNNKVNKKEITKNEELLVETERNIISNKINGLTSDLLFIADNVNSNDFDLKVFSNRKKIYDQIRYIDIDGNEKIRRINYSEKGSISVTKARLQNKKDRYYFKDTIGLKKDQIYISRLDLNMVMVK